MNNFFFLFFFARRKMANECITAAALQGGCCFNCMVPNLQLAFAGVAILAVFHFKICHCDRDPSVIQIDAIHGIQHLVRFYYKYQV